MNARMLITHSTGDMSQYKMASYSVWCMVRDANRWYQEQLDFHQEDTRCIWHGLCTIRDYKAKNTVVIIADSFINCTYFEDSQVASASDSPRTEMW